ncbi:microsomal triglyceride transfer protein large subunit-like isoform X2 [Protopterus annectens]|nr:microsomal triglyceride transfer protein large subunit-like isoform X2 [Protopterus annectens]
MLKGSGFKAEILVQLNLVWANNSNHLEQLVQIQFQELKVFNVTERTESENIFLGTSGDALLGQNNAAALKIPMLFHWNRGKVERIYVSEGSSTMNLDLQRGFISLFQLQLHSGTVTETDVSGECQVIYDGRKDRVAKRKVLGSCRRPEFGFTSVNKMFGASWQATSESLYVLEDGLIKSVALEERHTVALNLKSSVGAIIVSRQHLQLIYSEPSASGMLQGNLHETLAGFQGNYKVTDVFTSPAQKPCKDCPVIKSFLKMGKIDSSKLKTTKQFLVAVKTLRAAKKKDILLLLRNAPKEAIPFFIDAAIAARTITSLNALSEFLDFTDKSLASLQEKFLYAAAFSPRPSKELLHLILRKLQGGIADSDIEDSALIVTGALIGKLCRIKLCTSKDVEAAKEYILTQLKNSKDDAKTAVCLLGLKNAQLPETIPLLLQYTDVNSSTVSSAAVSSLQKFPDEYFTQEVQKQMKLIFHQNQKRYDRTVRLAAADIILRSKPSYMDVANILMSIGEIPSKMSEFLFSKIQTVLQTIHPARNVILEVLKDPAINNYGRWSLAGNSTSAVGLLGASDDWASTYSLELLFSESGHIRKSNSDFLLHSHGNQLLITQVSIEIQGLESLIGGTPEEGEEEAEAMAGMSATLFDVQLRPVVFFQGLTDLMSKFFSSSEGPTTVVKGNILLIDHLQAISLQSGLHILAEFQGCIGIDVSGDIDVSLWDQEAKTTMKTRGTLVINSRVQLDVGFMQAGVTKRTEAVSSINCNNTLNFAATPLLMCLQLQKDDVTVREVSTVYESLPSGRNFTQRKVTRHTIAGAEVPLHHVNNEMCKELFEN